MITVSGQLTDQLRDKKDLTSSLLTKAESFVTSHLNDLLREERIDNRRLLFRSSGRDVRLSPV